MSELIQKKIYLDEPTNTIVERHRIAGGFGGKGVSAAIRNIILEWDQLKASLVVDIERTPETAE